MIEELVNPLYKGVGERLELFLSASYVIWVSAARNTPKATIQNITNITSPSSSHVWLGAGGPSMVDRNTLTVRADFLCDGAHVGANRQMSPSGTKSDRSE